MTRLLRILRLAPWLLTVLPGASHAGSSCSEPDGRCVFAVFPHSSLRQVEQTYGPIAEELSLFLERDVQLVSAADADRFARNLRNGAYDLALVGISHFVFDAEPAGYRPLARSTEDLRFEIVTLPGSPYNTLATLRGRRFGQVPAASATNAIVTDLLKRGGLHPQHDVQRHEFVSPQACIHALASDMIDACGVAMPIRQIFEHRLQRRFRVVARSTPVVNVSYVANPALDENTVDRMRHYLVGRPGLIRTLPSDYDRVRQWLRREAN